VNTLNGNVIRDNEIYKVEDRVFEHLTVSKTILYKGKKTTGHHHDNVEEVYLFTQGEGLIEIRKDKDIATLHVRGGSIIRIPPGWFHQVENTGKRDLIFISVFENYR